MSQKDLQEDIRAAEELLMGYDEDEGGGGGGAEEGERKKSKKGVTPPYIVSRLKDELKNEGGGFRIAGKVPKMLGKIIVAIDKLILITTMFHMYRQKKNSPLLNVVGGGGGHAGSSLFEGQKLVIRYYDLINAINFLDEVLACFGILLHQLILPLKPRNPRLFDLNYKHSNESMLIHYYLKSFKNFDLKSISLSSSSSKEEKEEEKTKKKQRILLLLKSPSLEYSGMNQGLNGLLRSTLEKKTKGSS
jgi:hypothetical protein